MFHRKSNNVYALRWWAVGDDPLCVEHYDHPDGQHLSFCQHCCNLYAAHGWIPSPVELPYRDGQIVCPGNWLVFENGKWYVYTPHIFNIVYEGDK